MKQKNNKNPLLTSDEIEKMVYINDKKLKFLKANGIARDLLEMDHKFNEPKRFISNKK